MGGAHILKKNKKAPRRATSCRRGEKSVCSLTKDREKR